MEEIIVIIAIVFSVLSICLFFKIWGACNNIKRLADKFSPRQEDNSIDPNFISMEEAEEFQNGEIEDIFQYLKNKRAEIK